MSTSITPDHSIQKYIFNFPQYQFQWILQQLNDYKMIFLLLKTILSFSQMSMDFARASLNKTHFVDHVIGAQT